MKLRILLALIFPITGMAEVPEFFARGSSLICFQEFEGAVAQARAAADKGARTQCGARKTTRVSNFAVVDSGRKCQVTVKATYVCDQGGALDANGKSRGKRHVVHVSPQY